LVSLVLLFPLAIKMRPDPGTNSLDRILEWRVISSMSMEIFTSGGGMDSSKISGWTATSGK